MLCNRRRVFREVRTGTVWLRLLRAMAVESFVDRSHAHDPPHGGDGFGGDGFETGGDELVPVRVDVGAHGAVELGVVCLLAFDA